MYHIVAVCERRSLPHSAYDAETGRRSQNECVRLSNNILSSRRNAVGLHRNIFEIPCSLIFSCNNNLAQLRNVSIKQTEHEQQNFKQKEVARERTSWHV
jgi:hypothetical protein